MTATVTPREPTERLVQQAQAGDREALDRLVGEFRQRLRAWVESWSKFHLGPRVDADEVVQDTFVRAFRSLAHLEWRDDDSFFHPGRASVHVATKQRAFAPVGTRRTDNS